MPEISVVMPVRNGRTTLLEAINSILWQTYQDFHLVIVDDGSTDGSQVIAQQAAADNANVTYLETGGRGIVAALNMGLQQAGGRFIARMDADDVSMPYRFEIQRQALIDQSRTVMLGGRICLFGRKNEVYPVLQDPQLCDDAMMLFNPISHPTVMMRADALTKGGIRYREEFNLAEDYDLFSRLSRVGYVGNVPEIVLAYRTHPRQVSVERHLAQRNVARRIADRHLAESSGTFSASRGFALRLHTALRLGWPMRKEVVRAFRNLYLQR